MRCFSVNLCVQGWPCLVVGGGAIAIGKARRLVEAGARVVMIAPELKEPLIGVEWLKREASVEDLQGVRLVIAATDDRDLNRDLWREADRRGILAAAADDLDHAHFFMPAVLRRGELEVAVSTGGTCPAYAVWVRDRLEAVIDQAFGEALAWFAGLRHRMQGRPLPERTGHFKHLLACDFLPYFRSGRQSEWEVLAQEKSENLPAQVVCS